MNLWYETITRSKFLLENGYHPKDAFIIVLDGEFYCSIAGKEYNVSKNDICVFREREPFTRYVVTPLCCLYIQFDQIPASFSNGIQPFSDKSRMDSNISYLENAIKEDKPELVEHIVLDVLMLIYQHQSKKSIKDPVIRQCVDYLNHHYNDKISLDYLAKHFFISKQTLIARFKAETAKTPIEYLLDVRMQTSKSLLTNSDLAINEIALSCGFENVYYFSNSFKHYIGISPKEYRKQFTL